MIRLVSHLQKHKVDVFNNHPIIKTRKEAEWIARDFNDGLETKRHGDVLSFDGDRAGHELETNVRGVPWQYSHSFYYKTYDYTTGRQRKFVPAPKAALETEEAFADWQMSIQEQEKVRVVASGWYQSPK